jgi:hypothetical protein
VTENRGQVGRVRLLDGHLISDVAGTAADGFGRVEKALAWPMARLRVHGAVCAVVVGRRAGVAPAGFRRGRGRLDVHLSQPLAPAALRSDAI